MKNPYTLEKLPWYGAIFYWLIYGITFPLLLICWFVWILGNCAERISEVIWDIRRWALYLFCKDKNVW